MKRSASGTLNTAIGAAAAPPLPSQKASGGSAASSLRGDEDFSLSSIGVQSTVHRNLTPAELYEWALKVCRSQFFFKSLFFTHQSAGERNAHSCHRFNRSSITPPMFNLSQALCPFVLEQKLEDLPKTRELWMMLKTPAMCGGAT
jgi:hypothetical protein